MNELQIVNLEHSDITTWDFAGLKEELSRALSVYKTTVYGDGVDIWLIGQGDLIEVVDAGKRNVSGDSSN